MLNKIIDGISIKLDSLFGYSIDSENIKQGLKGPCFFILSLNPSSKQKLGTRSLRTYNFDIHYFPSNSLEQNIEMNEVMETLIDGLEYINLEDGLIRGNNIKAEIIDDVLHFFITYKVFVYKSETSLETMETLQVNQSTKR